MRVIRQKLFVHAAVMLLYLIFSIWQLAYGQSRADSLAIPIALEDLNGKKHSIFDLRGKKITVLVFWATWGDDSSRMLDDLQQFYDRFGTKGLQVIGICVEAQVISDSAKLRVRDTVTRKHLAFPILLDDHLTVFRQYNVIAVPTTFALSPDLKILLHLPGYTIIGREKFFDFLTEQFEGEHSTPPRPQRLHEPSKEAFRLSQLARREFVRENIDAAKKNAIAASTLDTLFVEPLVLLAEIAMEEKQLSDAAEFVNRVLQCEPHSMDALSLKGLLMAMQHENDKAIEFLHDILRSDSTSVQAHCYLGYVLGLNLDTTNAYAEFRKAVLLDSLDYRVPLYRSEMYKFIGKTKEAMEELRKAKKLRRK